MNDRPIIDLTKIDLSKLPQLSPHWPKYLAAAVALLLILIVASTAFFTVPAESEGVVLRFGKITTTASPGRGSYTRGSNSPCAQEAAIQEESEMATN